jgi:GTP-binding protein
MGIMNYVFLEYGPFAGEIRNRNKGVMVVKESCTTVAYALFNLQERGRLFIGPGVDLYRGQIIGENCRPADLIVNPAKGKKLTNMRASGKDDNIQLSPVKPLTLEQALSFIREDELVEVTPLSVRMRKTVLSAQTRHTLRGADRKKDARAA